MPEPRPGPGQVRIRVAAAAVNRIDLSTRRGALTDAGLLTPADWTILGWDVAGVVDEVGPGVRRRSPGDPVIGLRDVLSAGGAQAEFVVLDELATAPAPSSVPLSQAAALPLIGLTADRALALTGLRAGRTLLVTGAAGGVGSLLLQLAALRGIRTVAVAEETDEQPVRDNGADEFVTHTDDSAQPCAPSHRAASTPWWKRPWRESQPTRPCAVAASSWPWWPLSPRPRCAPPASSSRRRTPTAPA